MSTATEIEVPAEFAQALRELGLVGPGTVVGAPLTGGVSSDIWRIDTAQGPICAKRALAKLRVAADWRAPIERNLYEARWMRVANTACPGSAARVLGQHPALGVLVMNYLPAASYSLWKALLREGNADPATARQVGRVLGQIHSYSAARAELADDFPTDAIFFDIRLEPYLLATARRHPELAVRLENLVEVTRAQRVALVRAPAPPVGAADHVPAGRWLAAVGRLACGRCCSTGRTPPCGSPTFPAVRPALAGSYEALLHEVGVPNLLLDLTVPGPLVSALDRARLERAIGVIYRPSTERMSHYFRARLPRQFDAILYYDKTRAVEPLEHTGLWEQGEVPETYPTAL